MEKLNHIGKREKRTDAYGKVTGRTKFVTDIPVHEMVYAIPVITSIPFGEILSVNLTDAESDPDFLGFIKAEDVPGENQVGVILADQPLFAEGIVRYAGETIGLLIAGTREKAEALSRKVQVEYRKFEPILTIEDNKNRFDSRFHATNTACEHHVSKGDIHKGFDDSDHVLEAAFSTPAQEHYYLEPQGCIVTPLSDGRIKVLGSLQCPFYIQKAIARILNLSYSQVLVEQAPTGGAFGGKEDVPSEVAARAAVAAYILKRPVNLIYPRSIDIQSTSKRHPFEMHYKVGFSKDGKILAAQVYLEEISGAYATLSSVVSYRAAVQALGPYVIPNVEVVSKSYYTNLPPNGAFRGFGSPQVAFGHERLMDMIAEQLEMDPLELRLRNVIRKGDQTITGHLLSHSTGVEETLLKARESSRWKAAGNRKTNGRYLYGLGAAVTHYGNCLGAAGWPLDGSGVKISLHRDGSVTVAFGLVEMGQGALTAVSQMTADALGIHLDRITVLPTCTDFVPDSGPSVASRNVVMTGNAILDAAARLLPAMRKAAAERLNCSPDSISIHKDMISSTETSQTMTFPELAERMYILNLPMEVSGWWHVPELEFDPETGIGEAYFTYSYATHIVRVSVDTLTGLVNVEKIWAAHDIGKAINPAGIEGQVEGGTAQGIGWALTEDLIYHNGIVKNSNLSTYLLPTAVDSADVETIIVEDPEPAGPWGAKGIGEPAIIPTAAAVANAVSDAVGKQVFVLPLTPSVVLDLLENR